VQACLVRARREVFREVAGTGVVSQYRRTGVTPVHHDVVQKNSIHS